MLLLSNNIMQYTNRLLFLSWMLKIEVNAFLAVRVLVIRCQYFCLRRLSPCAICCDAPRLTPSLATPLQLCRLSQRPSPRAISDDFPRLTSSLATPLDVCRLSRLPSSRAVSRTAPQQAPSLVTSTCAVSRDAPRLALSLSTPLDSRHFSRRPSTCAISRYPRPIDISCS